MGRCTVIRQILKWMKPVIKDIVEEAKPLIREVAKSYLDAELKKLEKK